MAFQRNPAKHCRNIPIYFHFLLVVNSVISTAIWNISIGQNINQERCQEKIHRRTSYWTQSSMVLQTKMWHVRKYHATDTERKYRRSFKDIKYIDKGMCYLWVIQAEENFLRYRDNRAIRYEVPPVHNTILSNSSNWMVSSERKTEQEISEILLKFTYTGSLQTFVFKKDWIRQIHFTTTS